MTLLESVGLATLLQCVGLVTLFYGVRIATAWKRHKSDNIKTSEERRSKRRTTFRQNFDTLKSDGLGNVGRETLVWKRRKKCR